MICSEPIKHKKGDIREDGMVDHIVPLAKGGLHIPSNLQVLPATLNHQKKDLKIFHWSEYQPT